MSRLSKFNAVGVLSLSLLVGCAGAKIRQERTPLTGGAFQKTDVILVKPVNSDNTKFFGDKIDEPERLAGEKAAIKAQLAEEIIIQLNKRGFNAKRYTPGANGVVLEGVISVFDHGSGAARAWVGMGAGSSNLFMDVTMKKGPTVLADYEVVATSGGRGGLSAMSSFMKAHIEDAGEKTAEYIESRIK